MKGISISRGTAPKGTTPPSRSPRARPFFPFGSLFVWLCNAGFCLSGTSVSVAQSPVDLATQFQPGLVGEYSGEGFAAFTRVDDDAHFDGTSGNRDPRLLGKSFRIRWNGFLECKENGAFRFHGYSTGKFSVRINNDIVLAGQPSQPSWIDSQPHELTFGRHPIEIVYEATSAPQQFGLYWSGPQFSLEPLSHRFFSHVANLKESSFDRGSDLAVALRCSACHAATELTKTLSAPALTQLRDNIEPQWLINHLTALNSEQDASRRMPYFGMGLRDAEAIAKALMNASLNSIDPPPYIKPAPPKSTKKNETPVRVDPSIEKGQQAFRSVGCLACHQAEELGKPSLFDGGNLSQVGKKRTTHFFARWLYDPSSVNAQHRMPVFDLQPLQRADLALYLSSLGVEADQSHSAGSAQKSEEKIPTALVEAKGKDLLERFRCGACHALPAAVDRKVQAASVLGEKSDWQGGCLGASDALKARPGYQLDVADREALKSFWLANKFQHAEPSGQALLKEHNCTGCHARDAKPGLAALAVDLVEVDPELASRLAGLLPPALTGVGDKLKDSALTAVLAGKDPVRRPWLDVRMPKFRLTAAEIDSISQYLITHDRIPYLQTNAPEMPAGKTVELAAARLVTPEGFGCQSCHQIGSGEPPKVAINAHGSDLTMLGERVRPSWFQRWVRNPARIVPRMEMPAIQVAAKGVLNDNLDLQLQALWETLNTKGFEPPKPNPVRVVRNYNSAGHKESANVLTDVLETANKKFLRPLIVGLPNRHTVLFDLESGRLAQWWLGDTARQYTRGKSWYWDAGSSSLVAPAEFLQEIAVLDVTGQLWSPHTKEQFVVQFDWLKHIDQGLRWGGRMEVRNGDRARMLSLEQSIQSDGDAKVQLAFNVDGLQLGESVVVSVPQETHLLDTDRGRKAVFSEHANAHWQAGSGLRHLDSHRFSMAAPKSNPTAVAWTLELSTDLPADRFQYLEAALPELKPVTLECVPGFEAIQLPLLRSEMPTALAWSSSGQMYMASLKGRVFKLSDTDNDGLQDRFEAMCDDLPAPYGLMVNGDDSLDVLCKSSLIRLSPGEDTRSSRLYDQRVVADGWGYTADYHDWAVGLVRDRDGNYLMALPCQQDDRSEAAARWRGHALRLVPDRSLASHRAYRLETLAAGLRFPMGLALNRAGDLFATDNQGNFNPFNELNHLQAGKRYGFINKLENQPGFAPAFESPAVNLPHPWTRSVNGLCFLESPTDRAAFGPFEGDLIGCEYNGLSLIRMSLQQVGDQFQGAAYSFSRPVQSGEPNFEGPVSCAVAPNGDLYIGSIHDSGWGGGANTGSIVRLRFQDTLPLGIDEVRATSHGLEIAFTSAVDPQKATQAASYAIRSYRRVSTPAYGGDDQDERNETARQLVLSADGKTATMDLDELREGCVYEVNVGAVGTSNQPLLPSQAHYNMRRIPADLDVQARRASE